MAKKKADPVPPPEKVELVFFATPAGNEPVRDWLKAMDAEDRKAIGRDLMDAQFGWPAKMPLCRPMGNGLFEIRTELTNTIARVLICAADGKLVALHGFIKKTQTTPKDDLERARVRRAVVLGLKKKVKRNVPQK